MVRRSVTVILVYVCDTQPVPEKLRDELHGFRKLTNKCVHDIRFTPIEDDFAASLVLATCPILAHAALR